MQCNDNSFNFLEHVLDNDMFSLEKYTCNCLVEVIIKRLVVSIRMVGQKHKQNFFNLLYVTDKLYLIYAN